MLVCRLFTACCKKYDFHIASVFSPQFFRYRVSGVINS